MVLFHLKKIAYLNLINPMSLNHLNLINPNQYFSPSIKWFLKSHHI